MSQCALAPRSASLDTSQCILCISVGVDIVMLLKLSQDTKIKHVLCGNSTPWGCKEKQSLAAKSQAVKVGLEKIAE